MKISKIKARIREILPPYAALGLIIMGLTNMIVYYGARIINIELGRPYLDMTGGIDRIIPVVPGFALIYVLAFPFWYATFYWICRMDRERCFRLVATEVVAEVICGIIFILVPTTNVRPELDANVGNWLLSFIYSTDTPDNLFPSIHCLESWLCYIALKDEESVPARVKDAAPVFALLICLSTLFTKQHVFPDVVAGIVIADASWKLGSPAVIRSFRLKHRYQ